MSCRQLDAATGQRLRHLADPPVGFTAHCYVSGEVPPSLSATQPSGREWTGDIIYLAPGMDTAAMSYTTLVDAGAIDLAVAFGLPHQKIYPAGDPGSFNPHPQEGGGWEQAQIRGDEGLISHNLLAGLWAVWEQSLGGSQWARWYLTATAKPSTLIGWADELRPGPPPGSP